MATGPKTPWQALVDEAAAGKPRPLYIFCGSDTFLPGEAAKALAHAIVPEKARAFNLQKLTGSDVAIDDVLRDLDTFGFMSGKKVVWLDGFDLFPAKADIGKPLCKAVAAMLDGNPRTAARFILKALSLADLELTGGSTSALAESVIGASKLQPSETPLDVVKAAVEAAREHGEGAAAKSDPEALVEALEKGWAPNNILVVTCASFNGATRAGKALSAKASVLRLDAATGDRPGAKGAASGLTVDDLIAEAIAALPADPGGPPTKFTGDARTALAARVKPNDARLIRNEVEKLALFAAGQPITPELVEQMVAVTREDPFYLLATAVAERHGGEALTRIHELLEQKLPGFMLSANIGNELRRLLRAKLSIEGPLRHVWRKGMRYPEFQVEIVPALAGDAEFKGSPYPVFLAFQRAEKFTLAELRRGVALAAELDIALKSSSLPGAMRDSLLLETFVIDFLGRRAAP
jgi:DNA polymerase III delta subunit